MSIAERAWRISKAMVRPSLAVCVACCAIAPVLIIINHGLEPEPSVFAFKMIFVLWVCGFAHAVVKALLNLLYYGRDPDAVYLKQHYPTLWKRMYPMKGYIVNSWSILAFVFSSKYQNEPQELLDIQKRWKLDMYAIVWPFALGTVLFLGNAAWIVLVYH